MKMLAENAQKVNVVLPKCRERWGTKLGHITPDVSPNELLAAIMACDNDMALSLLSKCGFKPVPGVNIVTAPMAADFYGVDYGFLQRMMTHKLLGVREPERRVLSGKQFIAALREAGVRCVIANNAKDYKVSICEPDDGVCVTFDVSKAGKVSLLSPRMVLALSVYMTIGNCRNTQTVVNVINRLIASEYVGVALELRAERVRQVVESARMSAVAEVSKEPVPEVSESVTEVSAASQEGHETTADDMAEFLENARKVINASRISEDAKEVDYLKTLTALFSSMTAMAVTSFFKAIINGSVEDVMRKIMAEIVEANKM